MLEAPLIEADDRTLWLGPITLSTGAAEDEDDTAADEDEDGPNCVGSPMKVGSNVEDGVSLKVCVGS